MPLDGGGADAIGASGNIVTRAGIKRRPLWLLVQG
jgi:hypothetical protein